MAPLTCYGPDVALSPMVGGGYRVWGPDPKGWKETSLHVAEEGEVFVVYQRLGRRPPRRTHGVVPARRLGVAATLLDAVQIVRDNDPHSKTDPRGAVQEMERI